MINNDLNSVSDKLIPVDEMSLMTQSQGHAAVLVPIQVVDNQWHLLLTRRASTLRTHAGEVAFPGGMWEEGDDSPVITALRESEEEIALPRDKVQLLGGLKEMYTRSQGVSVRPVVGLITDDVSLVANTHEIDAIFSVPMSFFLQDQRLRTDIFHHRLPLQTSPFWVPAYSYKQYEIWGFTASVIVCLLNRCFGADIQRNNPAPEKIW